MAFFTKDSLEKLREKVDLVEVLSSHIDLKKSGSAYKALCPFHDERSPSFMIQRGDTHYHCFGCGAHGDAIQFLTMHLKMGFSEAVEYLAERFQVTLEREEGQAQDDQKGLMKELMQEAAHLYHAYLFHSHEGETALRYLAKRGIHFEFLEKFLIGLSPHDPQFLKKTLSHRFKEDLLKEAGLRTESERSRDFFSERIMFPIQNASGAVIGFSGRKIKEETYGGKYINTKETPLFKKSKVLFGLPFCRRRIAKERRAIIVEGQLDALRLIDKGLNLTVAALGTAFGQGHVQELVSLGVSKVYIAFDSDQAGRLAALKVGDLFQKADLEAFVLSLPEGADPDSLVKEQGVEPFIDYLEKAPDYLTFLVKERSKSINISSPALKQQLVDDLVMQIKSWEHEVIVQESLKKLASLMAIPESAVGIGTFNSRSPFTPRTLPAGATTVDPNRIMEGDLLRWLIFFGNNKPHFFSLVELNFPEESFYIPEAKKIYQTIKRFHQEGQVCDLLQLGILFPEDGVQQFLSEMLARRVNHEKAEEFFREALKKLMDREWMQRRDSLRQKIQSGTLSDDEALILLKEFDRLKASPPFIIEPQNANQ